MKYSLVAVSAVAALSIFCQPAIADDHHRTERNTARTRTHGGHSGNTYASHLTLEKAEWNARRQRLEVKVISSSRRANITVQYDDKTYPMRSRGGGEYTLRLSEACFADAIVIASSSGASLSASVQVVNGSAEGQYCVDPNPGGTAARDLVVFASNDLGMHCACPGTEYFMLLPPFNTLRAQVFERGDHPKALGAADGISISYSMVENTDESLKNDPYYSTWLENMPKYGFGSGVNSEGRVQGLTGATLSGQMTAEPEGWWEVVGVPAYPDISGNSSDADKIMTDPLGGGNRNPYPTAKIEVFDSNTGQKLAETTAIVPVAFGGCCSCHLQVTEDHGLIPDPANSFALMGQLHARDSGINFAEIDPDGDGTPGPIRCSACHLDPAMGETVAPGYPGLATSQYTFSDVLHRWHVQNPAVLEYNQNLATDCYACHPGNNVGCFRGVHADKGMWCTDCHGDLNQRVEEGQLQKPWSADTLPKCNDCHQETNEGGGFLNIFGGAFLNSMGHVDNKILCSSCHGSPHSLYPSLLSKDNEQPMAIQGSESPIGNCSVCHTNGDNSWSVPIHGNGYPSLKADDSTGGTNIDAAAELASTCLNCHGDRSSRVSCARSGWTSHDGRRVSTEIYDAVTAYITGSVCATTDGGDDSHDSDNSTSSGLPSDHTDSEDGVMHKPGKDHPFRNGCTSCHGGNLRGDSGPSCYSCHGEKWD